MTYYPGGSPKRKCGLCEGTGAIKFCGEEQTCPICGGSGCVSAVIQCPKLP